MFVIVVVGGIHDGKKIDRNGELGHGVAPLEFEDLADAQDWIERNLHLDFGGSEATLEIDET